MSAGALAGRALAPPDPAIWNARAAWFWHAHDSNAGGAPLPESERVALLLAELEAAFCAGAWAAVVALAWAIVEGEERAAARGGRRPPDAAGADWLRERRNRIVHGEAGEAPVPDEAALEETARGAVRVVFAALFAAAWG